jgi:hypothetical protein
VVGAKQQTEQINFNALVCSIFSIICLLSKCDFAVNNEFIYSIMHFRIHKFSLMDLMFFQEIVCQITRVHVKLLIIENCTPAFYIQENLQNFFKKWNFVPCMHFCGSFLFPQQRLPTGSYK